MRRHRLTAEEYLDPTLFPLTTQGNLSLNDQLRIDAFNYDQMQEALEMIPLGLQPPFTEEEKARGAELTEKMKHMPRLTRELRKRRRNSRLTVEQYFDCHRFPKTTKQGEPRLLTGRYKEMFEEVVEKMESYWRVLAEVEIAEGYGKGPGEQGAEGGNHQAELWPAEPTPRSQLGE